jgi:hypothetical protein
VKYFRFFNINEGNDPSPLEGRTTGKMGLDTSASQVDIYIAAQEGTGA